MTQIFFPECQLLRCLVQRVTRITANIASSERPSREHLDGDIRGDIFDSSGEISLSKFDDKAMDVISASLEVTPGGEVVMEVLACVTDSTLGRLSLVERLGGTEEMLVLVGVVLGVVVVEVVEVVVEVVEVVVDVENVFLGVTIFSVVTLAGVGSFISVLAVVEALVVVGDLIVVEAVVVVVVGDLVVVEVVVVAGASMVVEVVVVVGDLVVVEAVVVVGALVVVVLAAVVVKAVVVKEDVTVVEAVVADSLEG